MKKNNSLFEKLVEYSDRDVYPMHMPGHKRRESMLGGKDPFDIDITEIHDFDYLHEASGVIKDSMDFASDFFDTRKTYFLVNGSTSGLLAAIMGSTKRLDTVLVAKNCHRAVFNAIKLRDLKADYIKPDIVRDYGICGGISSKVLEDKLKSYKGEIKAVIITSPTYEGMVSDVESISRVCHKYGAMLIVDEAHGAHFGLGDFPKPAYKCGADIVIESAHKTLNALTQTAFLHVSKTSELVDLDKIEEYLGMLQSSSPSYVFMASLDRCVRNLAKDGEDRAKKLLSFVDKIRTNVNNFRYLSVLGAKVINKHNIFDVDKSKITIFVDNLEIVNNNIFTGFMLEDFLRDMGFEVEMSDRNYVLAMTTMFDDFDKLEEFISVLKQADDMITDAVKKAGGVDDNLKADINKKEALECDEKVDKYVYRISQVDDMEYESVDIENVNGRICADFVLKFPPGIPMLIPGQVISDNHVNEIISYQKQGLKLVGINDNKIKCIK